ncbi:GNAT family N-acetyltransferase [Primorskyibacter sp. S187A]|uniref:GNAT family N-acetyltransferase n=1 Tax=Primorskyibacter sp. S187A TaxID=3415130 RepID=UPI003C7C583B
MTLARGTRCLLRRMSVDDAEAFLAYRSDPEVARYQSWPPMDATQAHHFLADVAKAEPLLRPGHWAQIAIADGQSNALLGDMGLFLSQDTKEAELGITLSRGAQGRGIAHEAVVLARGLIFAQSPAQVIWGIADLRNAPSLTLLARTGFLFDHDETTDGLEERFFRYPRPAS